MVKEFTLSDEWRILRKAVSVYYKNIEREISSVIYAKEEKINEGIYNKDKIKKIQQNETFNALTIVYKSIFKKFFNITSSDNSFKSPKWQDKISCEDLTRLILLLQEATQIVKKDRGDYTYIEAGINEIKNEDFLSLNLINNDRGFDRCSFFAKEEIENKDNFKAVFEKYLKFVFDEYRKENYCRPLTEYLEGVIKFTDNNSFLTTKHKKYSEIFDYPEDKIEEKGLDYDGRNIVKVTTFEGFVEYFADGTKVELCDIQFREEENDDEIPFDTEKFIKNNKCLKNDDDKKEIDEEIPFGTKKEINIYINNLHNKKLREKKLKEEGYRKTLEGNYKENNYIQNKDDYRQPELFDGIEQ